MRKFIVLGCIVGLVMVGVVVFFISHSLPSQPNTPIGGAQNPQWKVFQNTFYSIQYPYDWVSDVYETPNSGQYILFLPPSVTLENPYPSISVSDMPALTPDALSKKIFIDKQFGLKESTIVINGTNAQELSGTVSFKVIKGKQVPAVSQQKQLYVTRGGRTYIFVLSYEGRAKDTRLEELFQHVLTTFTLL